MTERREGHHADGKERTELARGVQEASEHLAAAQELLLEARSKKLDTAEAKALYRETWQQFEAALAAYQHELANEAATPEEHVDAHGGITATLDGLQEVAHAQAEPDYETVLGEVLWSRVDGLAAEHPKLFADARSKAYLLARALFFKRKGGAEDAIMNSLEREVRNM